jgi:hypothetical protein
LGFPIRISPARRLLASPRGVSPLAASFFAYWHLGIHTPALSSLTIKLTLRCSLTSNCLLTYLHLLLLSSSRLLAPLTHNVCFVVSALATCSCPSLHLFSCQRSFLFLHPSMPCIERQEATLSLGKLCFLSFALYSLDVGPTQKVATFVSNVTLSFRTQWWAWVDSNYRPHPYQGCALTT